jgi:hypothetical protein
MIQELQALLEAYAQADKERRKGPIAPHNWEPQHAIHFEILHTYNHAIVRHGDPENPVFYLQPRHLGSVTYDTAEYKTR